MLGFLFTFFFSFSHTFFISFFLSFFLSLSLFLCYLFYASIIFINNFVGSFERHTCMNAHPRCEQPGLVTKKRVAFLTLPLPLSPPLSLVCFVRLQQHMSTSLSHSLLSYFILFDFLFLLHELFSYFFYVFFLLSFFCYFFSF